MGFCHTEVLRADRPLGSIGITCETEQGFFWVVRILQLGCCRFVGLILELASRGGCFVWESHRMFPAYCLRRAETLL